MTSALHRWFRMPNRNDEPLTRDYVDRRVNPLAEQVRQVQTTAATELMEKNKSFLIEMNSRTFEKAQSYTTVIIAGAYAGMFAVWSSSKDSLSAKASAIVAACLTFSLTVYVIYEVVGIAVRTFHFVRIRREISRANTPQEFADFTRIAKNREAKSGLNFVPYYAVSLFLTLLPAMISSGLLIYNNISKIVGWPRWPM